MEPIADKTPTVGRHSPDIRPDFHLGPDPAPEQTSTLPERRLLLLGMTGAGKSSSGNTILGEKWFHSKRSSRSVTAKTEVQQADVAGRSVSVVDTPGLFDTERTQEDVVLELGRCIYECSPGPHALLIVLSLNVRFTQQENQVTEMIRACYGEGALKYTIILFTGEDQLEGQDVKEYIEENKNLSALVNQCGGRYHVFNNKDQMNRRQVTELLNMIDVMVDQNGGGYYSNEMLKDAERCKAEAAEKVRREQEVREHQEKQQRREEIKTAVRETEERIKREIESQSFTAFLGNNWKLLAVAATGGIIGAPVVVAGAVAAEAVAGVAAGATALLAGSVVAGAGLGEVAKKILD